MGTSLSFVAVLSPNRIPKSPDAQLDHESESGWRVFVPRDRYAYPSKVERIAGDLVREADELGVVGFVEDSDWSYLAGFTSDGPVTRLIVNPEGAEDYEEGEEVLSLVGAGVDLRRQAESMSMFALLIGRQLSPDRIIEIARSDDTFAENPMYSLLDELGIDAP